MSNFEGTLELKSPLSKECWDILADVELKNTERIWFTTPSEKRVEYIKADVLDKIRSEIEQKARPNEIGGRGNGKSIRYGLCMALQIIDKYKAEIAPRESEVRNESC